MAEYNYATKEGLEKLKEELRELTTKGRADIAKRIQEARDKGDLSENAEYDAAKEAQGLLELKISKLQDVLSKTRLIDDSNLDSSKVFVLSTVKIKNLTNQKDFTYQLVSEKEADLKNGKISVSSPIGKSLLGKQVGEIAEVSAPSGAIKFEILEISRS